MQQDVEQRIEMKTLKCVRAGGRETATCRHLGHSVIAHSGLIKPRPTGMAPWRSAALLWALAAALLCLR